MMIRVQGTDEGPRVMASMVVHAHFSLEHDQVGCSQNAATLVSLYQEPCGTDKKESVDPCRQISTSSLHAGECGSRLVVWTSKGIGGFYHDIAHVTGE